MARARDGGDAVQGEFLPGLHALRGLAALWVVLFHIFYLLPLAGVVHPLIDVVFRGPLGVDLFFVMSGYIIARRYGGTRSWTPRRYRDFIVRRLARIYPLHLLMLLCTAGFIALTIRSGDAPPELIELAPPGEFWRHLFLVQAWGRYGHSLNVPAWSISVEWLLYLLFPLLALPFVRGGRGFALLCIVLLCGLRIAFIDDHHPRGLPTPHDWMPLLRGVLSFGCGMALERLLRDGAPAWIVPLGWLAGLAVIPAAMFLPADWPAVLLFLPLTAAAALRPLPGCPERLARVAGDLSYPLYIVHGPVVVGATSLLLEHVPALHTGAGMVVLTPGLLALSLLLAWRAHRRVETPARRWIVRRFTGDAGPSLDKAPSAA